jgi:hypothetical protein
MNAMAQKILQKAFRGQECSFTKLISPKNSYYRLKLSTHKKLQAYVPAAAQDSIFVYEPAKTNILFAVCVSEHATKIATIYISTEQFRGLPQTLRRKERGRNLVREHF